MKKIYILLYILLMGLPVWGQKETEAKKILDKVSSHIAANSGIKTTFRLRNISQKTLQSDTTGDLLMKGSCFVLTTPNSQTWFNGKTQWTYLPNNEEMNISNPTAEELRSINPYSYLTLYQKGFNYKMTSTTFKGKSAYQITLTPEKKGDIAYLILWVRVSDLQVVMLQVNSSKEDYMIIETRSYQEGQNLKEGDFQPNLKEYPDAEIIDLR